MCLKTFWTRSPQEAIAGRFEPNGEDPRVFDLALDKAPTPSARLRMVLSTISLTDDFHVWISQAHPEDAASQLAGKEGKRVGRGGRAKEFAKCFKSPDLVEQCLKRRNRHCIVKRKTGSEAISAMTSLVTAEFDRLSQAVLSSMCELLGEGAFGQLRVSLCSKSDWYNECKKEYECKSCLHTCIRCSLTDHIVAEVQLARRLANHSTSKRICHISPEPTQQWSGEQLDSPSMGMLGTDGMQWERTLPVLAWKDNLHKILLVMTP